MNKINRQMKSPVMPSPALLPRTLDRSTLDADSCLAFKMNTPIYMGQVESYQDDGTSLNSPGGSMQIPNTPSNRLSKFS